jgi:hypothetical protein
MNILSFGNSEYIISFLRGRGVPCGKNIKLLFLGGLHGGLFHVSPQFVSRRRLSYDPITPFPTLKFIGAAY